MYWFKNRLGKLLESGLHWLDAAVGLGFLTTATVAVFAGKLLLAGILLALALGVFLRFFRRRTR